jgi:hypothetical protein
MLAAARAVDPGFKIMVMFDMSGSFCSKSQDTIAKYAAQLMAHPSQYRLPDGRAMFSAVQPECQSASWWSGVLERIRTTYNTPVAFTPVFLNEQAHADAFAPISYQMGNWGSRNPMWNPPTATYTTGPLGRAKQIKDRGLRWMQPVSVQDERPNQGIYDEAENTTNLRYTWEIARKSNADSVQLVTWNDYGENTHTAPSTMHGHTFLDIQSYYLTWYKTGVAPTIVRDQVYLTHRRQPHAAKQTTSQTLIQKWRGGSPARDTVEALTFLKEPGTVTVTVGSATHTCNAPAGVSTCTVPLSTGTVAAKVTRGGAVVTNVTSPHPVTTSPTVQDLQYVGAASGRTGNNLVSAPAPTPAPTQPAPAPTPTPTPTTPTPAPTTPGWSEPTVVTVPALADTYANAGAPSASYGGESSLASRGGSLPATAYLRFAIPNAPPGKQLVSAQLRLRTTTIPSAPSADTHTLWYSLDSWAPSTVSWNAKPQIGWYKIGQGGGFTAQNTTYTMPLGVAIIEYVAGSTHSFAMVGSGDDSVWFWSNEYPDASARPKLVLVYQ